MEGVRTSLTLGSRPRSISVRIARSSGGGLMPFCSDWDSFLHPIRARRPSHSLLSLLSLLSFCLDPSLAFVYVWDRRIMSALDRTHVKGWGNHGARGVEHTCKLSGSFRHVEDRVHVTKSGSESRAVGRSQTMKFVFDERRTAYARAY